MRKPNLKMTMQLLKQGIVTIYQRKNNEHTPKKGDFNRKKTMKTYSKVVILSK